MSAQSTFPAFIRAEYDGSSGGFPAFERAADQAFGRVEGRARQFERSFQEIGKVVTNAISGGLNSGGGLDLKVGEFRQAAAQAQFYEKSLRDVQAAANLLAKETGDISSETTKYLQALNANVNEAQRATLAADAQVATYTRLQAALDATTAKNSQLAASYRALFTEQAKQAEQEVVARRAQEGFTAVFAPGLTRSATSNGAGFTALEDQLKREGALIANLNAGVTELEGRFAREAQQQAQAASQAAAAISRQADELDRLRSAEAAAANAADMLSGIFRNTPIGNGAAVANGAGFEAIAADMQRAETAAQQYSAALNELRQQVDPAFFAQQRFDSEMSFAAEAMRRGDITAAQYASRMNFLSAELKQNAASTRATRFASVQLGQQLQDVVIQAQMGTNAFIILAQQGSQAAYALTGMEGAVGKVARVMAGWQGAIILASVALIGQLVPALFGSTKATEEAEKAAKKHREAIEALQDQLKGAVQSIEDKARATYIEAAADYEAEAAIRAKTKALLEQAKANLAISQSDSSVNDDPLARAGAIDFYKGAIQRLQAQLKENETSLSASQIAATRARGLYQSTIIDNLSTPEGRIRRSYENKRNAAIEAGGSSEKVSKALQDAVTWRDAELKKIEEANKAAKNITNPNDATTAQVTKILVSEFGGTVTSAKRTAAENARVGGAANSYHLSGHAIDFVPAGGMGSISKAQIRQTIEAAGLTVKELLGPGDKGHSDHYHVAWSGGKGEIDSARIAAQVMAEQQRAADELARSTETLIQRFDTSRAAETEYGNSLSEIDRLRRAGMITEMQAKTFANQADIQLAAAAQKRAAQDQENLRKSLFGDGPTAGEQLWTQMQASMDRSAEDARRIAESMSIGADAIGRAFGGKFASILNEIARIDGSDGTFGKALGTIGKSLEDSQKAALRSIGNLFKDSDAFKGLGKTIGDVLGAAGIGVAAGSLALGSGNSKTGSAIGGALGKVAGKALGDVVGGTLGKALGPLGSIAGGILGGMIGGLFKKAKFGSVTIGATGSGTLGLTGSAGNSGAAIKTATKSGNAVIDSIEAIAQQLGGTIDASKGSVSIGTYKGKYRVDTSGQGRTKGMTSSESTNESLGLFNFGDDADAAVKFAMLNLVQDGVIVGIRAGSQKLLKNAKDIETGLSKALKFENVFRDLRKFKDPVGAAIDDLNLEFKGLIDVFKEAGATAEETAQLEELYGIKRKAATEDAIKSLTGSLKDLIDNLTIGDSGYSLRTRLGNAKAAYDPLAARVQAGDTTAYDEYAKAAQTLVDLQREYSGSQQDYFTLLDSVTQLTKGELNRQQAQISSSTGIGSPFDTTPIVTATQQQQAAIVDAINAQGAAANDNQGRMIVLMQQYLAAAAGTGNARLAIAGRFGF